MRIPRQLPPPRSRNSPPSGKAAARTAAGAGAFLLRAAAGAAALILAASCSPGPRTVVALDEAFAATRPALSALLQDGRSWGRGPFSRLGKPLPVPIALAKSPGIALDAVKAEAARRGGASSPALIASPLVAKAIVEGGSWSGDPPLLVPEWRGSAVSGLWSFTTDPVPAYRAAGAASGAFVAALARSGGSPSCGLVYSEAPTRPRAALAAFAEAYAENSEGCPLQVREIGKEDEGPEAQGAGAAPSAAPGAAPEPQGAAPGSPAEGKAETAVTELLGSDMRVLFVALGRDAGAAIRTAARPGLAIGADFPYPESPPALAFKISPNDSALQKALISRLAALREASGRASGGASGGASSAAPSGEAPELIPALLVPEAQAASIRAGKIALKSLVEESALRVKASR